jgi:hypothetical protein
MPDSRSQTVATTRGRPGTSQLGAPPAERRLARSAPVGLRDSLQAARRSKRLRSAVASAPPQCPGGGSLADGGFGQLSTMTWAWSEQKAHVAPRKLA